MQLKTVTFVVGRKKVLNENVHRAVQGQQLSPDLLKEIVKMMRYMSLLDPAAPHIIKDTHSLTHSHLNTQTHT